MDGKAHLPGVLRRRAFLLGHQLPAPVRHRRDHPVVILRFCGICFRGGYLPNPNVGDYRRYIDDRPVFRQFFCPGCGALIENEIALASDPVLRDIEVLPRNGRAR